MDLKKTISILYNMELNNFYMTNVITIIEKRIDGLGKASKSNLDMPDRWEFPFIITFFCVVALGGIVGGAIGIIGSIAYVFHDFRFFYLIALIPTAVWAFLKFGLYGLGLGAVAGLAFDILVLIIREIVFWFRYSTYDSAYKAESKRDKARVDSENLRKKVLVECSNSLKSRKRKSEKLLASFYSRVGIDSNYRNIVAIGYMNEFIRLGVATKLEGTDGLYYLIMKELKWDQMQYTLNDICLKLDRIIDNQRMIYRDLSDMRRESKKLAEEVIDSVNSSGEKMNKNFNALKRIEEYNGRIIAKELEYQNYFMRYGA